MYRIKITYIDGSTCEAGLDAAGKPNCSSVVTAAEILQCVAHQSFTEILRVEITRE